MLNMYMFCDYLLKKNIHLKNFKNNDYFEFIKYICDKKTMRKIKSLTLFFSGIFVFIFLFQSCSSTTTITTEPTGAKVYVNNIYAGETPLDITDTKISTECTGIRIEKEGFKPLNTLICKDEQVNTGAAIGGFFIWPIWLWIFEYYPQHNYILEPMNQNYSKVDDNHDKPLEYTVNDPDTVKQVQGVPVSKAQKLQDLKKLYDDGILTKQEYEKEKQKILEQEQW